jgi:hypothetical protein
MGPLSRWARWAVVALVAGVVGMAVVVSVAMVGLGGAVAGACDNSQAASATASAPTDAAGVPADLLPIYTQAAARYQLGSEGWAYLASINAQETDFGRNLATSSAGAVGWMQFKPSTWKRYGVDGNNDGTADPNDKWDAIFAAANYLHASGAPADWGRALYAYNHAGWYVKQVTQRAQAYLAAAGAASPIDQSSVQPTTDAGGIVAATIYGNAHDDTGKGAYGGESLRADFGGGSPPFAELGGPPETKADLLGHLPSGTPLRITNPATGASIVAYKHDWGHGQGSQTLSGHRYRIDLWWQTAEAIGIHGSALVEVEPASTTMSQGACGGTSDATTVPGAKAKILPDGTAAAPADAPAAVQKMIAAGNEIHTKPYPVPDLHFGSLAKPWPAYDCSGAVSYLLYRAGLLGTNALNSTGLRSYGQPDDGRAGHWVTIYTTAPDAKVGHAWIVVAGIAFDTANFGGPNIPKGTGPRWRTDPTGNLRDGQHFIIRHPPGL